MAQSIQPSIGARYAALAYASAAVHDEWSLIGNVSGVAKVDRVTASFTYDAMPSFTPFNRMAAVFAVPVHVGVAGIGVYRFGDDIYSEQILTGGFANSFGLASLGVRVNFIQYRAEGFGTTQALTVSAGGIAELTPKIAIGAYIDNVNQPELSNADSERLPTVLHVGMAVKPSDKLLLAAELEKDLDYSVIVKTGIEYQLHRKILARTGFALQTQTGSFGVGVRPKKFWLDYSFLYNTTIGCRHQATVAYKFKSK